MFDTLEKKHFSGLSQNFDTIISGYKIKIEGVFDHQESRENFRLFLKKVCLNDEPFLFYEAVERYQKTRLDKNRLELADDIVNQFIVVSAKHELNLSLPVRSDILNRWKQIKEQNQSVLDDDLISCPSDLFNRAQDIIFTELKDDNFPRFLQSDIFKQFIKKELKNAKNGESILDKIGSKKKTHGKSSSGELDSFLTLSESDENLVSMAIQNTNEKDRSLIDTSSPYVTNNDYAQIKQLIESSSDTTQWEVVSEKAEKKTLVSKSRFYFNQSDGSLPIICCTGVAPGSHIALFNLIFSRYFEKTMEHVMKRMLQIEHVKIDAEKHVDYPNTIIYAELDTHFPVTKRELLLARTIIPDLYNEETDDYNRYCLIQKPSSHPESPLKKDIIRCNLFSAIIVERLTHNSFKYYVFDAFDPKGKVPKILVQQISKMEANILHKIIVKKLSKFTDSKEKSLPELVPISLCGTLEVFREHLTYLKSRREEIQSDQQLSNEENKHQ